MTENSLNVTEQRDETAAESVTASRAHALPWRGVTLVTRDESQRDVTVERDSDNAPASLRAVTITRNDRPLHEIQIEPWPWFDEHGRDWWRVRVVGRCGTFRLSWSRRLQRLSVGKEAARLANANGRLLFAVRQHLVAALGVPS